MRKLICCVSLLTTLGATLTCGNTRSKNVIESGTDGPDAMAGEDAPDASSACLVATVGRHASTTQQPWVKWPLSADGVGTLIVSASQGSVVRARRALPNADFKADNASFRVDLGCLGPGTYTLMAFLDDNMNAGAEAVSSKDAMDSCMGGAVPEKVEVTLQEGKTTNAELTLYLSCDPLAD